VDEPQCIILLNGGPKSVISFPQPVLETSNWSCKELMAGSSPQGLQLFPCYRVETCDWLQSWCLSDAVALARFAELMMVMMMIDDLMW